MNESTKDPYSLRDEYLDDMGAYFRSPGTDPQEALEEFAELYNLELDSVFPELEPDHFEDRKHEKTQEWKQYLHELTDIAAEEFYDD